MDFDVDEQVKKAWKSNRSCKVPWVDGSSAQDLDEERPWTAREVQRLRALLENEVVIPRIAEVLHRTPRDVLQKIIEIQDER